MNDRDGLLDQLDGVFARIGRLTRKPWGTDMTMTFGQYAVLRLLSLQGPLTMGTIAGELEITMAGATGLVDRLIHAGIVQRTRSEQDRRVVSVDLSPLGREKILNLRAERRRFIRNLLNTLDDSELQALHGLLERVAAAAEQGNP
ncbi:MAG: MarR family transcriptional regulator [Thermaerobacter sp.]|nr:MarR family transcriptional regulator [Thermaerobacter sp.]